MPSPGHHLLKDLNPGLSESGTSAFPPRCSPSVHVGSQALGAGLPWVGSQAATPALYSPPQASFSNSPPASVCSCLAWGLLAWGP